MGSEKLTKTHVRVRDLIDVATDAACGVGNTYGGEVLEGGERNLVELGLRRLAAAGWTLAPPAGRAALREATDDD